MVSIMDLLNGKGSNSRSSKAAEAPCQSYAPRGPEHWNLMNAINYKMSHSEAPQYYAGTLTVSTTYRVTVGKTKRIFANLDPIKQKTILRLWIRKHFEDLSYMGFYEWTKRGVAHWHFIVAHPLVKIENSLVVTSIHRKLTEFGKVQQLEKMSNSDSWIKYITKEYHPDLDNHEFSNDFEQVVAMMEIGEGGA